MIHAADATTRQMTIIQPTGLPRPRCGTGYSVSSAGSSFIGPSFLLGTLRSTNMAGVPLRTPAPCLIGDRNCGQRRLFLGTRAAATPAFGPQTDPRAAGPASHCPRLCLPRTEQLPGAKFGGRMLVPTSLHASSGVIGEGAGSTACLRLPSPLSDLGPQTDLAGSG